MQDRDRDQCDMQDRDRGQCDMQDRDRGQCDMQDRQTEEVRVTCRTDRQTDEVSIYLFIYLRLIAQSTTAQGHLSFSTSSNLTQVQDTIQNIHST